MRVKWMLWRIWKTFSQQQQQQPQSLDPYPPLQNFQECVETHQVQCCRISLQRWITVRHQYHHWLSDTHRPMKTRPLKHQNRIREEDKFKGAQSVKKLYFRQSILPNTDSIHPILTGENFHCKCWATWPTQSWVVQLDNDWSIDNSFVDHIFYKNVASGM